MSKRMSGSVLLLATLAFTLIAGDVMALIKQDPPAPPPPGQTQPQTQSPSEPQTKPQKRGSKKTRPQVTKTEATPEQVAPQEPTMPAQETPATPAQTTAAISPTEQTDLSGTYAGTFTCDALGLSGDTTLTITGNQFTTAEGKTGRIVASTTRGYTAVALQTGEVATGTTPAAEAAPTTPTIVSMRARKSGDRLTLTSVPGSMMECAFAPTRNVARTRRSRQRTPAATGTEVSNPATMPSPISPATTPAEPVRPMPEPSQTPSPSPSPSPTPMPTPEPNPSPEPSPSPTPVPTPSGSPTPAPVPTATPSPTPNPSPSPRPRG
jgi:hypothetical protein